VETLRPRRSEACLCDELAEEVAAQELRAVAAEERLRQRTVLFAEAEHRLKTAVSVIKGWATTLDEHWARLAPCDRRGAVATIRRTADALALESDRVLEQAAADNTASHLSPAMIDLCPMLRDAAAAFSGVSGAHTVRFQGAGSVWAFADRPALEQVVAHLVDNAIKYSPDGGEVVLRARPAGPSAEVLVRDTGVGLPAGVDVFAPFARGGSTAPGVGLGLHIVRTLVEAMDGAVDARPNRTRGATFVVRLPARRPALYGR
jgi:signal transduction histidine kinase